MVPPRYGKMAKHLKARIKRDLDALRPLDSEQLLGSATSVVGRVTATADLALPIKIPACGQCCSDKHFLTEGFHRVDLN